MSQLFLDLPARPDITRVWKGIVAQPPLNFTARCSVIVPDMNPDLAFENVRWQARDNMSLPLDGDSCLVLFDNNNEPWIPVWWPQKKRPSIHTGKWSDGAPPNPVEDDIWIAEDVTSTDPQTILIYNNGAWESTIPDRLQGETYNHPSVRISDANNAVLAGWYACPGAANAPENGWGQLMVMGWQSGYHTQIFTPIGSNKMWIRYCYGGTYGTWSQIASYSGDAAWTSIALQNGFTNYSNGYAPARYRRLASGLVIVQGLIARSSPPPGSTQIAVLPSGYLPSAALLTSQPCAGGIARIDFWTNGIMFMGYQYGSGAEGWCSLNFSYYADQ